jgi:hypothetical protein
MPETIDLKALESRAYRSFFADGIWDICLGLMLLGFGIGAAVSRAGVAWGYILPDLHVAMLACFVLATVGLIGGKKYLTVPRLGAVRFGAARRSRTLKSTAVLAASALFGLAVFWLVSTDGAPLAWRVALSDAPFIFAINCLIVFGLLAHFLDFRRLYVYAVLWAVTLPASRLLVRHSGMSTALAVTITASVGASLMLGVGVSLLVRFLRTHPLPTKAATDSSD